MNEIWKTVVIDGVEHPRYKVSSLGRIICLNWNRTGNPRLCKLTKKRNGYLEVCIDGVRKLVHRLVAEAFLPNPQNKPCIDHIDTNRQRNVIEVDENGVPVENSTLTNIRWVTYKENDNNPLTRKHKSENNGMFGKLGSEHNCSISIVQLTLDGQFIKKWAAASEVERELGINRSSIIQCCKGKRKSAGGFKWMYLSDWLKVCKRKPEDIKPLF